MRNGRVLSGSGSGGGGVITTFFFCLFVFSPYAVGQINPSDVLILVNSNSPTSRYIAKMYRQYYPQISEAQILHLSGLVDCSGPASTPASEIITRTQYNQFIAGPVRAYLADSNYPQRITSVKVIITTAGLPYRIKDSNPAYANAVYPAGSNATIVGDHESDIDAASVESELSCLWYSDYGMYPFGLKNRMINPYQGYIHSGVELFGRLPPGSKNFSWTTAVSWVPSVDRPLMEGISSGDGTKNRKFNIGDIYITARLDGPKIQGASAVFAVRAMLERAKRASDPSKGVNPAQAVAVIDDAPACPKGNLDRNRTFNLNSGVDFWEFHSDVNQPPDATTARTKDDYRQAYTAATGLNPSSSILNVGKVFDTDDLPVMLDLRASKCTSQSDLDEYASHDPNRASYQGLVFLATFGVNGDEGNRYNYLTKGLSGGALFKVVNGAVFTSLESFNAVTMFSDVNTQPASQGKLVNFIEIGGTGAVGHSFEPQTDAAIDNEFLLYNLLADEDGDGRADLTFGEAAFTAIPYLSWCDIVIGDPLMRIAYGPGGKPWKSLYGDATNDGRVNFADIWFINGKMGGVLNTTDSVAFERYNDLCDINQDGRINNADIWLANGKIGTVADW